MSLCFHTYVSELAKVLQSKVAQSKSKWKEKIPLIVSASVIQWKLQKVSFQGELAEKMILQAKAIEVIHSTIWYTYSVHLKKKKAPKNEKHHMLHNFDFTKGQHFFLSCQIKRREKN